MSDISPPSAAQSPTQRRGPAGWSRRTKIISGIIGAVLAGATAYAATNWTVGLGSGSSGQAQSGSVSNVTITAVAAPSPANLLFPGGTGDVVATIANPNTFPVTITAVNLPTNATYANGFSNSTLTTAVPGCAAGTPSGVTWNFATGSSGTSHTLTTPITVAATGNLTITFTNDASMSLGAPAACEATFFSMPSLTGITATGGAATVTVATTDAWTA